jgi:hypothetical protein
MPLRLNLNGPSPTQVNEYTLQSHTSVNDPLVPNNTRPRLIVTVYHDTGGQGLIIPQVKDKYRKMRRIEDAAMRS